MKKFDTINVIPFIDIMLVLLAIVLVVASFINQGKIEVTTPDSTGKTQATAKDFIEQLTITQAGQFYYKNRLISLTALDDTLQTLPQDTRLTVKIDAQTPFQVFVRVTDLLKKHQLQKVSVITTQTAN